MLQWILHQNAPTFYFRAVFFELSKLYLLKHFLIAEKKRAFFSFLLESVEETQHTMRQQARVSSVPGLLVTESKPQIFIITDA